MMPGCSLCHVRWLTVQGECWLNRQQGCVLQLLHAMPAAVGVDCEVADANPACLPACKPRPRTTTPPISMASHIGPIMKPQRKMRVPTWLSGAAVTATTMYRSTATHDPGKRSALQAGNRQQQVKAVGRACKAKQAFGAGRQAPEWNTIWQLGWAAAATTPRQQAAAAGCKDTHSTNTNRDTNRMPVASCTALWKFSETMKALIASSTPGLQTWKAPLPSMRPGTAGNYRGIDRFWPLQRPTRQ